MTPEKAEKIVANVIAITMTLIGIVTVVYANYVILSCAFAG